MRKVGVMLVLPEGERITVYDLSEALEAAGAYLLKHGNVEDVNLEHPRSKIGVIIRKSGIA